MDMPTEMNVIKKVLKNRKKNTENQLILLFRIYLTLKGDSLQHFPCISMQWKMSLTTNHRSDLMGF